MMWPAPPDRATGARTGRGGGRHGDDMRIELRAVSKSYGALRALDRASLEIQPGQVVAVIGANGAGKTTLLRCLAGIAAPDQGLVYYDDEPFRRDRLDLRRRLHFLPDFPFLMWELTALQHLGMMLRVYGAEAADVDERVIELLRDFDLLPLATKPLQTLSRGQMYKVALAGLMAVDPELWLLDEPFASGMDPHGLEAFRRQAGTAARMRGRTVIYTTQILEVAERFADRVCVLHGGEVRAFETLARLRELNPGGSGPLEAIFRQLRQEGG